MNEKKDMPQGTFQHYTLILKFVSLIDQGEEPAIAPIRAQGAERRNKRSRHTCDLCDKVIIGDLEWKGEADSPRHTISDFTFRYLGIFTHSLLFFQVLMPHSSNPF